MLGSQTKVSTPSAMFRIAVGDLEGWSAVVADLMNVPDLDPAMIAYDLPPFHGCAAGLMRADDESSYAAAGETEVDEEELARCAHAGGRLPIRRHQCERDRIVHAMVQIKAGIVGVLGEIGGRRHVLPEEAGPFAELGDERMFDAIRFDVE